MMNPMKPAKPAKPAKPTELLDALAQIAPLAFSESWDNTGLLLEPLQARPIRRVFLTIDLTEPVFEEALAAEADFIVAYHPPIFGGLKRITTQTAQGRVLGACFANGIPIYSPHTALDAAAGGMNDWLADGLGPAAESTPIKPYSTAGQPVPGVGSGRRVRLQTPAPLDTLVARIKAHLGLDAIRLAASAQHTAGRLIESVAVCPGAGGSLFEGLGGIDLLLTGEMRHHDVLARVAQGVSVVLTEHTNTERGYLPTLAARITSLTGLEVSVSTADRDPLTVV